MRHVSSSSMSSWMDSLSLILRAIDQNDPFLVRMRSYWARVPEIGPTYTRLIADPRPAIADRAALYVADSTPMLGTKNERLVIAHCMLEIIRILLPSQRALITFDSSATKREIAAGFSQFWLNLLATGLWEDFLDFVDRQIPGFATWTGYFRAKGFWEILFSLSKNVQNIKVIENLNLSMLQEKYGRDFTSFAEAEIYGAELRLNKSLAIILADPDPVHYGLEVFSREHHWPAFTRQIIQGLLSVNTIDLYELPEIQLLGLMLADFISPTARGVWFNNPDANFGHDYSDPVLLEKRTDTASFSVGETVINALDHVADVVKRIFIDRVDDGLVASPVNEELSENEQSLRYRLITFFEKQLIKRFLANPYTFGFDRDHPLYKETEAAFNNFLNRRISIKAKHPTPRDILERIFSYSFVVDRKIYDSSEPESVHANFHRTFRERVASSRFYEPEAVFPVTDSYSVRVLSLRRIINNHIASSLRAEMVPLLSFVQLLIQSRSEDIEELVAVFALGFQRSPWIDGELSSGNILYIAFSKSLDKDYHDLFLDCIWHFSAKRLSRFGINHLQVLHSARPLYTGRFDESKSLNFEADRAVYQFIFRVVLGKIFLTDPAENLVHPDLVRNFISSIVTLIESLPASKARIIENTSLQSLLLKLKSSSPRPLSEAEYLLLERFLLDEHKYSCAESIIARYGVTTNYLPFMFRRNHPLAVQKEGAVLTAGVHKRLVVKPCHRCQLLSSAYLLWQEMNRKWDVDSFEERAMATAKNPMRFFGSASAPTLFSSAPAAIVQARASPAPDVAMNQLFEYLSEEFGLERQTIAKDGNCQFSAIAYQLHAVDRARFLTLVEEAGFCPEDLSFEQQIVVIRKFLRLRVVSHMSAHRVDFDGFICEGDSSFDDYLTTIRRDGPNNWGDNLTLRALKDVLEDFNIVTLRVGMEDDAFNAHHILLAQNFREPIDMSRTLVIVYNGSTHYETIRNRPDARLTDYLNHILHPFAPAP